MKRLSTTNIYGLILFVLFCWVMGLGFLRIIQAEEQLETIVIIGNLRFSDASLRRVDVQNIFLGKKRRVGKQSIAPVILKEGETHEAFLQEYLKRTPSQYNTYWKKMIFTGKGKAPKVFKTEAELLQYVQDTEHAIGYLSAETAQRLEKGDVYQFIVQ